MLSWEGSAPGTARYRVERAAYVETPATFRLTPGLPGGSADPVASLPRASARPAGRRRRGPSRCASRSPRWAARRAAGSSTRRDGRGRATPTRWWRRARGSRRVAALEPAGRARPAPAGDLGAGSRGSRRGRARRPRSRAATGPRALGARSRGWPGAQGRTGSRAGWRCGSSGASATRTRPAGRRGAADVRVTLLTVGSRGDVQPSSPSGPACGRPATTCDSRPIRGFEPLVTQHGLAFAPLAEGHVSRGGETEEGRRWIAGRSRRLPAAVGFLRDARSVARERLADAARACEDADAIVAAASRWCSAGRSPPPGASRSCGRYVEPPAWMITRRSTRRIAPAVRQAAWLAARPWLNGVRRERRGGARCPSARAARRPRPPARARPLRLQPRVLPPPPGLGDWFRTTGYWFLDGTHDPEPPPALGGVPRRRPAARVDRVRHDDRHGPGGDRRARRGRARARRAARRPLRRCATGRRPAAAAPDRVRPGSTTGGCSRAARPPSTTARSAPPPRPSAPASPP